MKEDKTVDSLYVQQHLANERTFLAWVRTAIAIVGLGFLAAGLVFRDQALRRIGQELASVVGIGAVLIGGLVMALATKDYLDKRAAINKQTFRAPRTVIWLMFAGLGLLDICLAVLAVLMLIH